MLKKFIRLKQPTQFMKIISDTSVEFVINVSLKNVFKKHIEKVHETEETWKSAKVQVANKSSSQKGESKHYMMNKLIKFNHHPSV